MLLTPLLTLALALQSPAAAPAVDLTLAPETAQVVLIVEGRGTQNYTCALQGSNRYAWTFAAPEAQLFNLATGKLVGHHAAGPSWTLEDGSSVQGTLLAKKPGDSPADVPWLLLRTKSAPGSAGTLAPASLVRRYNTHGGTAPTTGCAASDVGTTVKVPYTATYAFYTEGPSLTRP